MTILSGFPPSNTISTTIRLTEEEAAQLCAENNWEDTIEIRYTVVHEPLADLQANTAKIVKLQQEALKLNKPKVPPFCNDLSFLSIYDSQGRYKGPAKVQYKIKESAPADENKPYTIKMIEAWYKDLEWRQDS